MEMFGVGSVKEEFSVSMNLKKEFINLNGALARMLNMKGYYKKDGIYVAENNYIVTGAAKTTTDYELEQMIRLQNYLNEKGIRLLYVNAPTKYTDDFIWEDEFGRDWYSNRNADLFLQRIANAGIDYIDLREELEADGMNIYDMFYRTDHHWTTKSGLWATSVLARTLNERCGYQIDCDIYNESNFSFTEYKNAWLGEQGRKIAESYIGLDDYTLIKPLFDTNYSITTVNGALEGSFDIMLDEKRLSGDADVYAVPSWHYTYFPGGINQTVIHNNLVTDGKILILGDSYSQVVVPFLSLGVSEVSTLVLRSYGGSLREFIDANDFDTVVILYAQFMIGAHDDPQSANYDMFTFD